MKSEDFRNDPFFLRNQFSGYGIFEMPVIKKQDINLDNVSLIGYDKTKLGDKSETQKLVHFFLDDYKFEVMWNDPEPRLIKLNQYRGVLSPQFSVYYTMPTSLQIYNTFRSRWCGAYFQSKGINVIPTVLWGLPQSYWYCFDGIEKGSIVAVSTIGVRKEKDFFMQGFNEMLKRIHPSTVICYGKAFDEMKGNIIEVSYEETNNLKSTHSITSLYYVKKTYFYPLDKGMGLAGGGGGGGGGSQSEIKPDGISGEEGKTIIPQKPIEQMPENVTESLGNIRMRVGKIIVIKLQELRQEKLFKMILLFYLKLIQKEMNFFTENLMSTTKYPDNPEMGNVLW